jgi:hypothetical protein
VEIVVFIDDKSVIRRYDRYNDPISVLVNFTLGNTIIQNKLTGIVQLSVGSELVNCMYCRKDLKGTKIFLARELMTRMKQLNQTCLVELMFAVNRAPYIIFERNFL